MPELPEVETTRRGLEALIIGKTIADIAVRDGRLRWPVDAHLGKELGGGQITALGRRGKYLLVQTTRGTLIVHLGMSGSLRYLATPELPSKHDHVDVVFHTGDRLRFHDPRRFGSLHFSLHPEQHPLLADIGPEPLGPDFTADYLWQASRGRRIAIKTHIMDSHIVAGIGNIYANEALFRAMIRPSRQAGRISQPRINLLVQGIRAVLKDAIERGGTTLRDFRDGTGHAGYFQLDLKVYDREGEPCPRCGQLIRRLTEIQRGTWYCPHCQR